MEGEGWLVSALRPDQNIVQNVILTMFSPHSTILKHNSRKVMVMTVLTVMVPNLHALRV